ncbi:DUF1380 domain-containing protein [Erwinia mallotivora]|uniref:DUF1380 domain-containing protein n=1 Tax=Erwinia mallotivora TaxID=69222 RepID=UPI0021C25376|nr:DUF1380 domain-containing protein [Erwinia mallotivora]
MYGTVKELCERLLADFPADEKIDLIVWTLADVREFLSDMKPTDDEAGCVLACLEQLDAVHECGVSTITLTEMLENLREEERRNRQVSVSVSVLARVIEMAEKMIEVVEAGGGEGAAGRMYPFSVEAINNIKAQLG